MQDKDIIAQTRCWVENIVIGEQLCPFASQPFKHGRIRYTACHHDSVEACMMHLIDECLRLDRETNIETTLLIYSKAFSAFDDFLDALELAHQLLMQRGYEGVYQLASFHPEYCFHDAPPDDAANYTNRSPWPMLHLLREPRIGQMLARHPNPQAIPQRNIEHTRWLGIDIMRKMLDSCRK